MRIQSAEIFRSWEGEPDSLRGSSGGAIDLKAKYCAQKLTIATHEGNNFASSLQTVATCKSRTFAQKIREDISAFSSLSDCQSRMREIKVRLARETDYQGVVEMSAGIYSGHDYFPCIFLDWLNQSNRLIFVAEIGEKLVGLRAINIIDDGKTFISQGLRIHPGFRGLGLSSRLISEVHDYIREHYPSVARERFTTKSDNVERLAIQKKQGDRAVLDQDILAYHCNNSAVSPEAVAEVTEEAPIKLHPYSKEQISEIILSGEVANTLFEESTLVIDWEPFEALRSNIDFLFQEWDVMFADRSPSEYSRGEWPKSFSHGRRSERVECVHWVATIYTDDPVLFNSHVMRQLKAAFEMIQGEFIFSTFHKPAMSDVGRQVLTDGLKLKPVDFFTFGLRLFEKEFR